MRLTTRMLRRDLIRAARLFPRHFAGTEQFAIDGTRLLRPLPSAMTEHVEAVRGSAENSMFRDELVAKCRDLIPQSWVWLLAQN